MEQIVQVRETRSDGTALVVHVRPSACSGDCHKCAGCGAQKETILLTAENPIGAEPGDLVILTSAAAPVLRAAAVLYLMPILLFFLGYGLGALAGHGMAGGGLGFGLGIILVIFYDRRVAGREKTIYTIKGLAEPRKGSPKKGDNEPW